LWAVFEPRSNTTRRRVFQNELAAALAEADCVVVAQVARLEQLAAADRLDPGQLMRDIAATGRPADYLAEVEAIVRPVQANARPDDVVCVFSNGGFEGIHSRLLTQTPAPGGS
jgi:UDP-N-acetylmuramate: L-alanyl-gamma-D-glutamyl-meso-diaminopimelate ligase